MTLPNKEEHGENVRFECPLYLLRFQVLNILYSVLLSSIVYQNVDTPILFHHFLDYLQSPKSKNSDDLQLTMFGT